MVALLVRTPLVPMILPLVIVRPLTVSLNDAISRVPPLVVSVPVLGMALEMPSLRVPTLTLVPPLGIGICGS